MDQITKNVGNVFKNNSLVLGMEEGWTQKIPRKGYSICKNTCPVIWLCNRAPGGLIDPDCKQNSWHIEIHKQMSLELRNNEDNKGVTNNDKVHHVSYCCAGKRTTM
jgi:hypothetical protein